MIDLSNLHPAQFSTKTKKRIGRGESSGRGKTSGKGHKGQNARSGGGVRLGFEGGQMPLYRRLPKRGFKCINTKDIVALNLRHLDVFEDGSVIDFAKGFRYYLTPHPSPLPQGAREHKLIAVPTTAGTGSEATQFAVIYVDGVKKSLDDKSILPEYAIVDSQFVVKNPKYLKACTGMDAFCHAIESYWAVKSTPLSREYAKNAILVCRDNLINYVNSESEESAANMMLASNLAGKAINISRTTAAHALSYKITSEYGLPHGHAVALSIADLYNANYHINESTCIDKRGSAFVKDRINEISEMLGTNDIYAYWYNLMEKIGLEYDFNKLNITDKQKLIASVNIERLKNNPKDIKDDLHSFWN